MPCALSHDHFREIVLSALSSEYSLYTCAEYARHRPEGRVAVLRHDIDLAPELAPPMAAIEAESQIAATYFFRVHANEYNAFSHENLAIIRDIADMGHEIGLHAEPLDLRASCGIDPETGIRAMIAALSDLLGKPVVGIASHNDITPDNNLHFFREKTARDLGAAYEAYDAEGLDLFDKSWYITDGHFWKWRAFDHGVLTDNEDCVCKHVQARRSPLYCLFHPHVWYKRHPHRIRY
jgi:hypothetical protein